MVAIDGSDTSLIIRSHNYSRAPCGWVEMFFRAYVNKTAAALLPGRCFFCIDRYRLTRKTRP